MSPRSMLRLTLSAALTTVSACSLLVQPNTAELYPGNNDGSMTGDGSDGVGADVLPDEGIDTGPQDTGSACGMSCNDNVPCTVDLCDTSTATCTHTPNNALCTNGQVCDPTMGCVSPPCTTDADCASSNVCNGATHCINGACVAGTPLNCGPSNFCAPSMCDPTLGCVMGQTPSCDDNNPCTQDSCDPQANSGAGACVHLVTGTGCPPPNDTCPSAQAITITSGTMQINGTTVNASNDVQEPACNGGSGGDVFYSVTYPAGDDLTVFADISNGGRSADSILAVRTSCSGTNLICNDDVANSDRSSRLWIRAESAAATGMRTLVIIVDSYAPGAESPFVLNLAVTPALPPAYCGSSYFAVDGGGTVLARSPRNNNHYAASCARPNESGCEDIYTYAGAMGTVNVSATAQAFTPALYVQDVCGAPTDVACSTGSPAMVSFDYLGGTPGYIFVDDAPLNQPSFYEVDVLAP